MVGTQTTRFLIRKNEQQNISFEKWLQRATPDGWGHKHPHSVLKHCVSLPPFLVVHHHYLIKVILIGIEQNIVIGIEQNIVEQL